MVYIFETVIVKCVVFLIVMTSSKAIFLLIPKDLPQILWFKINFSL